MLKSAEKTEGLGKRGGIFAILVVIIVILAFVGGLISAAGEGETDEDRRRDSLRNSKKYSAQMKGYLEEGDYISFEAFVRYHSIPFDSEPYIEYKRLDYVAENYYDCVKYWEKVLLRSDDPDYWDSSELDISHLCTSIDSFMDVYAYNSEHEKNEESAAYIKDMNTDIRTMLKRYLKMTDKEVDEFLGYSETKKAVVMEDIILGEVSEDE
ncbi:hypothetical protein [Ruminococcus sp. HUN007]|uniref:hypothetical protein n=1 Tax=Ruminococcus sp. HUN007 TaxID=1514668 RepID=UPI0005D23CAC|nr:hypothetical protein [Ruminococcus sp. HUN007]